MASAMTSPMALSAAEIDATCAISDLSSTSFDCLPIESASGHFLCCLGRFC
jgi:hypothetical protein